MGSTRGFHLLACSRGSNCELGGLPDRDARHRRPREPHYQRLAASRETLDRYLRTIHESSPKSDPSRFPTRQEALAYYLNAYNALVFEGVLSRGPEKKSVWRGLISGYTFFIGMKVVIGGETTSLKKLEDKVVREQFRDPRVHAALNCASLGCPHLPRHAFEDQFRGSRIAGSVHRYSS